MYRIVEHTADLGIHAESANPGSLFAEAGRALFAVIAGDLSVVRLEQAVSIRLPSGPLEFLLVDWLTELLFCFESRGLLLANFDVAVDNEGLTAVARGERFDASRHSLEHEVKAITYHDLAVRQRGTNWTADVLLDI